MIKKTVVLLLSLCIFVLTSCSISDLRAGQLSKLTTEESEKIESMSEEIIRCLTEKDSDGFCKLFSQKVREEKEFNNQIENVFSFFKCDGYTTADIDTTAGGGEHIEFGKKTEWYVMPEIKYIEVIVLSKDNADQMYNRYYQVYYDFQIIDQENPELEGLNYFVLELLNLDESVTVGVLPDRGE